MERGTEAWSLACDGRSVLTGAEDPSLLRVTGFASSLGGSSSSSGSSSSGRGGGGGGRGGRRVSSDLSDGMGRDGGRSDGCMVRVEMGVAVPDVSFDVVPISPLALAPTPLVDHLLCSSSSSSSSSSLSSSSSSSSSASSSAEHSHPHSHSQANAYTHHSGFLTLDHVRRAVPLLEVDPLSTEYPLVGVWTTVNNNNDNNDNNDDDNNNHLSSSRVPLWVAALDDPSMWRTCARYMTHQGIRERVSLDNESTFLLMVVGVGGASKTTNYNGANGTHGQGDICFFEVTSLDASAPGVRVRPCNGPIGASNGASNNGP